MKKKRNYGGRYPLPKDRKKNNSIRVRLSESDMEQINTLHDCSQYETLSELIRAVLLQKPISVRLQNIELYHLELKLGTIEKNCSAAIKSKKITNTDLQLILSDIRNEILKISTKLSTFEQPILLLKELEGQQLKRKREWYDYWNFG